MAPKKLNDALARAKAPRENKPVPKVDDTPERIASAIQDALTGNNDEAIRLLKEIAAKEFSIEIDVSEIGEVVAKEIRNLPTAEIHLPDRKPISYRATVTERDRNRNLMVARIDPIED